MAARTKRQSSSTQEEPETSGRSGKPLLKAALEDRARDIRLGFLIHDVSRMRKRAFDEFMKPMGITRSQWWVIGNLSRHDGMMQTQLANMLDVGKASLGMVLDRLEANGLIERRVHPIDRRGKCVFMTRKAQQLVNKMLQAEQSYDEMVLKHLSDSDRDQLLRLLDLIKRSLNEFGDSAKVSLTAGEDLD